MPVAGRLKQFLKAWQILTGDQEIVTIAKGYQMPFLCQPHQKWILTKINFSQKEELVSSEIGNFLKKVSIEPVCVELLQENRKKKDGKNKKVNLKKFKQLILYSHFKLECLQSIKDVLKKCNFMC